MGDSSQLLVPFGIHYIYEPDEDRRLLKPLNSLTKFCHEAYEVGNYNHNIFIKII